MATNSNPTGQITLAGEQEIIFLKSGGHNHDGQNSSPVSIPAGSIGIRELNPSLLALLANGSTSISSGFGSIAVPDLIISTPTIAAGGQLTGNMQWTSACIVRYMRVLQSVPTECRITFYHTSTYADADREFRAENCGDHFLWEGNWAHNDDLAASTIYYKIENTGNNTAQFQITLKSATAAANGNTVSSLTANGVKLAGDIIIAAGAGIQITTNATTNTITITRV